MTEDDFHKFVSNAPFKFAHTMPWIPHSYTLIKQNDKDEFIEAVRFIQKNGVQEKFGRRFYTYYYCGDYKYWTMGGPAEKEDVLNRADKNLQEPKAWRRKEER
jgi:hypothetical protein